MFVALVVSVVADVARPDTAPDAIAIATLDADVICPVALTVYTGTVAAPPYVAADTPEVEWDRVILPLAAEVAIGDVAATAVTPVLVTVTDPVVVSTDTPVPALTAVTLAAV
jgi:hypothetical protein